MNHPTATTAASLADRVDLKIRITTTRSGAGHQMSFVLDSPSRAVRFLDEPVRGNVIRAPEDYQRNLLSLLEKLTAGHDEDGVPVLKAEAEREVTAIGRDLYHELFPRELRRIYDEIRDDVETLLILSDEPWIPWEIIRPDRRDDDDFLCLKHEMSRWLTGTVHLADERLVRRIACIDAGPASHLKRDGEEKKLLEKLKSKVPGLDLLDRSGATLAQVGKLLETESFDLFHYAGHGRFDPARAAGSKIELSDRALRPRHLSLEAERKLARERPLVFFNSCQVGRVGVALTELSGWAPHWVRKCECSAFLAPIWAVGDEPAYRFAEVFYESLFAGATLGKAVQHARTVLRTERPGEISWLAYSLYGPPNGRVVFGEAAAGQPAPAPPDQVKLPEAGAPRQPARPVRKLGTGPSTGSSAGLSATVKKAVGFAVALAVGLVVIVNQPWEREDPGPPVDPVDEAQSETTEPASSARENLTQEAPPAAVTAVEKSTATAPPPPPPPQSTIPLSPIVPGKVAVLALNSSSGQTDSAVARAARAAFMGATSGLSFQVPTVSSRDADQLAQGTFPTGASGSRTPWGAEYLVAIRASHEDRPQQNSVIKSVMLNLQADLIRTNDQATVAFAQDTHNGTDASTDGALTQAAERCLRALIDHFNQGAP